MTRDWTSSQGYVVREGKGNERYRRRQDIEILYVYRRFRCVWKNSKPVHVGRGGLHPLILDPGSIAVLDRLNSIHPIAVIGFNQIFNRFTVIDYRVHNIRLLHIHTVSS